MSTIRLLPTSRLKAFSDGVYAIVIILLVLDLKVPESSNDLGGALLRSWPAFLAYLVSFRVHRQLVARAHQIDRCAGDRGRGVQHDELVVAAPGHIPAIQLRPDVPLSRRTGAAAGGRFVRRERDAGDSGKRRPGQLRSPQERAVQREGSRDAGRNCPVALDVQRTDGSIGSGGGAAAAERGRGVLPLALGADADAPAAHLDARRPTAGRYRRKRCLGPGVRVTAIAAVSGPGWAGRWTRHHRRGRDILSPQRPKCHVQTHLNKLS
ncbi:TMEM175 family protein [Mycobacterium ulcerans]|uniref:TMEM175 family protein n=1 Tax=Mycobacterium ulcerans TaxID=1809 RepID=UPI001E65D9A0|nr:TMEM175 family protein [Mycobacterium ulcerans]MEB3967930.1 TMEM175 family protein [Mycobacterium ulcerans]MEB3977262.1 TMEM175 family protein [Mycobacterium ulcerans]MEB4005451.1 TMEM175 family protein [Mycobacterium ulcerans]MEB4416212.1 TMEM175 family protein [Mycobacterium ulcerans]MEB4433182.1 TMEM175 family protein [Mycobacterium ulcerans]